MSYQRNQTVRGQLAVKLLRDHVTEQYSERLRQHATRPEGFQVNALSNDFEFSSHSGLPRFDGIPMPPLDFAPPDSDDQPDETVPPNDDNTPPNEGAPEYDDPPQEKPPPGVIKPAKVCIVGAGASGIYMAWMLTYLGIDYDLLESSDRIGGRVYTYDGFKQSENPEQQCAHNYYDVGAMRIPKIGSNMATIHVMNYLEDQKLLTAEPYYLKNLSAPSFFNRDHLTSEAASKMLDPLDKSLKEFNDWIKDEKVLDAGFQKLIRAGLDQYSTREYLRTQLEPHKRMDFDLIQQLETFDTGTGLFDQSFLETILDYADFPTEADWFRIEGGMIKLIEAMAEKIKENPAKLNQKVKAYKMDKETNEVQVTITGSDGTPYTNTYMAVFNSTTLGALGRIELNDLGSPDQLTAIRSLSYDSAAKIAIKFKSAWWITQGHMKFDGMPSPGGISGTDLPVRVVAYPAWTDKDDPNKPTVLIASYTWHQDAIRMGSLIDNKTGAPSAEALELVLRNLSAMFITRNASLTYEWLKDQMDDSHGYAWQNDAHSSGAFALFGPGQFTNLYPALFSPLKGSNNSVYLIGEAASAHHAWIAGAFNSAATSLYGWLIGRGTYGVELASKLKYSGRKEHGGMPFGKSMDENGILKKNEGVPDEMDEDVLYWMAQLALDTPTDDNLPPP